MKKLGGEKDMIYKKFLKGFGLLAIIAFSVGILTLSIKTQKVNAEEVANDFSSGHMSSNMLEHMNQLSQDDKQQMVAMMKQHHGDSSKQECSHLNDEFSKET